MGCLSPPWRALMRRNMLYLRRNWISTILEVLLPVLFLYILVAIKNAVESAGGLDSDIVEATFPSIAITPLTFTDYVTALRAKRICLKEENVTDDALISGLNYKGENWQVPLVKCDARKCWDDTVVNGQDAIPFCEFSIVAVAGEDDGGKIRANEFKAWVERTYPAIVSDEMPFDFELVQVFDSSRAMSDYVQRTSYGDLSSPKIAMGIVWDGNDSSNYAYHLRPNSTNFNSPDQEARPGVTTMPTTGRLVDNFARDDDDVCIPIGGTAEQGPFQGSCTGQYLYNGVLTFQRLVNDFILEQSGAAAAGYKVAEAGVQFAPFPTKEYETSGFFGQIQGLGPLLLVLGLIYPVASMLSYVVKEKELRQKELMKMMSVTESDINWSWFTTFMTVHFFTATLAAMVSSNLYELSDVSLLWWFWLLVMITVTVFSMTIAALTSKSTRAVLVGLLLFFAGYILSIVFSYTERDIGLVQMVSLHPIAAFAYGLDLIGSLEGDKVGLTADSLDFSENQSGYKFRHTFTMLTFDCVFWGFMSFYLNRVIQPDYGQALPWYFPVSPSYWFPAASHGTISDTDVAEKVEKSGIPYEPVSDAMLRQAAEGKSIEIHNLRKVFGETAAVDGLNLSMYNGQITALLGHNGAGKTTTISMLTGAMAPTEGYATIAGKDIRSDIRAIRTNIGICLQHDCLFPNLTVREHIQFFSRLKGLYNTMPKNEVEEHIDQAIRDVALFEKRNTYSKNLSGGMKRKLSVAIAFCGGSQNVFLDEPTSGMDPFSRRFTWNVIRQYRKDRCIILTTHFMDEADILGDRIAIMAGGQLRCAGSSLFLKRHYGVGYQLTIEKNQGEKEATVNEVTRGLRNTQSVDDANDYDPSETFETVEVDGKGSQLMNQLVLTTVPEATVLNDVGTEVRYQLPLGASDKFAAMFARLDAETDRGNIVSYGVSMTTLDEVFLLVARGDHTEESKTHLASSRNVGLNAINEEDASRSARSRMDLETDVVFTRHVSALLKKRAVNFQRDKKAWCCTTILPVLFVTLGFLVFKFAAIQRNLSPVRLDLADLNPTVKVDPVNPISVNNPSNSYACQPGICAYNPVVASEETNETYVFCATHGNLAASSLSAALFFEPSTAQCTIRESTRIVGTVDGFQGAQAMEANADTIENSSFALYNSSELYQASQYGAIWFTREPDSNIVGEGSFNSSNASLADAINSICQKNLVDFPLDFISSEDCSKLQAGYGYVVQYNHTSLHGGPLFQTLADQALIRRALNNPGINITTTIAPLPITPLEEGLGESDDTTFTWLLIMLGFPFISAACATFVVNERESKAKHLQTVAGVEPAAYWISTFLWDTINYQIPLWLVVGLMFIFDVNSLKTSDNDIFTGVLAVLFFYGPAAAGYAYCWSFAFTSPSLCNIFLIVSGFLIGFAGPLTIFILYIIGLDPFNPNDNLENIANILKWTLRFLPPFCLGNGIFSAINIDIYILFEQEPELSAWSEKVLLYDVVFLVVQTFVYTGLAIFLDIWSNNPQVMGAFNKIFCSCCSFGPRTLDITTALPEDDDVVAEQDRVNSGQANNDLIVVSQLSKVYRNGKTAVNSLSLGIAPGECFGLLGINGAGKTTTMAMLTAEFPPSSGDATLAGYSITKEPQKIRRRVGYCPQFDAHFAQLSGRNHVELYASIKGIPREFVKEAVAAKLKEVGLSEFDSDRICSNYSGGMKRRLSLACATIGQPQIVFLDECSTGVDPVARREIWQLVSDMVSGRGVADHERTSVILTTHSMEECEALCPRIGIMANGRLRCLGSAQHLKNKFGQGFQVELKTKMADSEDADFVHNVNVFAQSIIGRSDEEAAAAGFLDVFFNKDQTVTALNALTNNTFLSEMIAAEHPTGYGIWKDSTSPTGVSMESLATFATIELRMQTIADFIAQKFPDHVLRERQDTKARYEVSAKDVRISNIFETIESNKGSLQLEDYGVSQTSLEQVFNMHAAEAEKLKQGRDDH